MLHIIKTFIKDQRGASAVEYGLIIGLIAVALIIVVGLLGGGIGNLFADACEQITGAACD